MLCKVVPGGTVQVNQDTFSNWFADFKPGDEILMVGVLFPIAAGTNTFSFVEKEPIAIFIEDIRLVLQTSNLRIFLVLQPGGQSIIYFLKPMHRFSEGFN